MKRQYMNQYLVTAYDHTDTNPLQHRMNVRPGHFDGARELKAKDNFILGGAILNDEGKMIGSVMVLQFESEEELQEWQRTEPYITQKVWETYEVKPFRVASV